MTTDWAVKQCTPCEGGIAAMPLDAARDALRDLNPAWVLDETGQSLRREYRFPNFLRVMSFVNAIAHIANVEDHHPDLAVGYNYCHVTYTTHAIGGLSENDFIFAAKIDRL